MTGEGAAELIVLLIGGAIGLLAVRVLWLRPRPVCADEARQ